MDERLRMIEQREREFTERQLQLEAAEDRFCQRRRVFKSEVPSYRSTVADDYGAGSQSHAGPTENTLHEDRRVTTRSRKMTSADVAQQSERNLRWEKPATEDSCALPAYAPQTNTRTSESERQLRTPSPRLDEHSALREAIQRQEEKLHENQERADLLRDMLCEECGEYPQSSRSSYQRESDRNHRNMIGDNVISRRSIDSVATQDKRRSSADDEDQHYRKPEKLSSNDKDESCETERRQVGKDTSTSDCRQTTCKKKTRDSSTESERYEERRRTRRDDESARSEEHTSELQSR